VIQARREILRIGVDDVFLPSEGDCFPHEVHRRGYEKSTGLAGEAYKSGKGILEIMGERKILAGQQNKKQLDALTRGSDKGWASTFEGTT
jgi:hypothetical protein